MTLDEVANLFVQPAIGPPGPRVLGLLAVAIAATVASLSRAAAHGWEMIAQPRPQPIPVEVPRRRLSSHQ